MPKPCGPIVCQRGFGLWERVDMPTVQANGIDVYYEVQGEGEPVVLIPYLAADQACDAFQVAEYAKRFTCFTVDLRGAGLSLGAATDMWLAAKHPERVTSLPLHSAWPSTDPFLRVVVEGWRIMAEGLGSVTDMMRSCVSRRPS